MNYRVKVTDLMVEIVKTGAATDAMTFGTLAEARIKAAECWDGKIGGMRLLRRVTLTTRDKELTVDDVEPRT